MLEDNAWSHQRAADQLAEAGLVVSRQAVGYWCRGALPGGEDAVRAIEGAFGLGPDERAEVRRLLAQDARRQRAQRRQREPEEAA